MPAGGSAVVVPAGGSALDPSSPLSFPPTVRKRPRMGRCPEAGPARPSQRGMKSRAQDPAVSARRVRARRRAAAGFTLVELIVALAVLAICLFGVARVLGQAAAGVARARRLNEALNLLDARSVTGDEAPAEPCALRQTSVAGTLLQWTWLEVDCGLGARAVRLVAR